MKCDEPRVYIKILQRELRTLETTAISLGEQGATGEQAEVEKAKAHVQSAIELLEDAERSCRAQSDIGPRWLH